jgi:hypothetical protein
LVDAGRVQIHRNRIVSSSHLNILHLSHCWIRAAATLGCPIGYLVVFVPGFTKDAVLQIRRRG